jgi:hypothetical protein
MAQNEGVYHRQHQRKSVTLFSLILVSETAGVHSRISPPCGGFRFMRQVFFRKGFILKVNLPLLLITVAILLTNNTSSGQWAGEMDVSQLVKETDPATKTWKDLYKLFEKHGSEDGVYGEVYSDYVAQSLANYWNRFGELTSLIKKDPLFEDFVLRHIDATCNPKHLKAILKHTRTNCPSNNDNLCKKIEKATISALE